MLHTGPPFYVPSEKTRRTIGMNQSTYKCMFKALPEQGVEHWTSELVDKPSGACALKDSQRSRPLGRPSPLICWFAGLLVCWSHLWHGVITLEPYQTAVTRAFYSYKKLWPLTLTSFKDKIFGILSGHILLQFSTKSFETHVMSSVHSLVVHLRLFLRSVNFWGSYATFYNFMLP